MVFKTTKQFWHAVLIYGVVFFTLISPLKVKTHKYKKSAWLLFIIIPLYNFAQHNFHAVIHTLLYIYGTHECITTVLKFIKCFFWLEVYVIWCRVLTSKGTTIDYNHWKTTMTEDCQKYATSSQLTNCWGF
jgi:hypothetical protein